MKKTGLKYIGILLLAAAFAAPFVWERWGRPVSEPEAHLQKEPMMKPPVIPAPPKDSVDKEKAAPTLYPGNEFNTVPKLSPVKKEVVIRDKEPEEYKNVNFQDEISPKDYISNINTNVSVSAASSESVPVDTSEITTKEAKEKVLEGEGIPVVLPPLAVVEAAAPSELDVTGGKIIRASLRLVNRSEGIFKGELQVKTPRGVKSISGDLIPVMLNEGDTLFVPTVFMLGGTVPAGENRIEYTLRDQYDREVEKSITQIPVDEKVSLQLSLDQPIIMVTHMNDSLAISARVHNRGNTDQPVTVVMGVPLNRAAKSFYELRGWVRAGDDSLFVIKVRPIDIQWNESNVVYINISGLYGPEKQTFGNVNLGIQRVVSSGRYIDNSWAAIQGYDNSYIPEDITLSYRQFGQARMYQVMGGGHINLPVGNIGLQGLIYKAEGQDGLVALNTQLAYRYNRSSIAVGNINEMMEFSTFGRGVKAIVSDRSGKNTFKMGVIDNQFNLLSARPLFENGYSIFVKDHIGAPGAKENLTLDYMFREDPWEKVKHHMAGGEWQWNKGHNWRVLLRSHGALSNYAYKNGLKPSGSAEVQYSGSVDKNSVSGNFYYSSSYFPGNRRGTLNLQQNFNRRLESGASIRANAFYSNFSPRSYHYTMDVETSNGRVEGVYTFPHSGNTGVGLGYQYQTETGNTAYLAQSDLVQNRAVTYAHRLVENLNWRNGKHFVNLGLENGVVKIFNRSTWEPQGRAILFYSFGRFNLNSTYQHGGYFLSEQNFAQQMNKVTRRIMANASWNQDYLGQDLLLNVGINYGRDFIMGSTWAASLNSRYRVNPRYSVFLAGAVYNYSYSKNISLNSYNSTMYNVEAGVSLNLQQPKPSTGKKSKLTVTVFHDKNGNNVRDSDETTATDYMILLDNKVFITDENGRFSYSSLPFGTYTVKAGAQAGWFHTETIIRIDGFKETVEIPLKQAGSVRGSIRYAFDERTAKDFVPVMGGLTVRIFRNGEQVQRAVTDNDGQFIAFLPNGQYTVELETGALDANAQVQNRTQAFTVEAGRISSLEPFTVEIRSKKINIRQFVQVTPENKRTGE